MKCFVLAISMFFTFEAMAAPVIVCRDDYNQVPSSRNLGLEEAIKKLNDYLATLPPNQTATAPTIIVRGSETIACVTVNNR